MARATLLLASLLALFAAGCSRDAPAPGAAEPAASAAPATTGEASAGASPADASPAAGAPAPPAAAATLPAALPRVDGELLSFTAADDGAVVAVWVVTPPAGDVVAALAAAIAAGPLELLLEERALGGGIVAFEGVVEGAAEAGRRIAGHYLVTVSDGTRVELRLDPPPPPPDAAGVPPPDPVALPAGFPEQAVPLFPGATVVAASAVPLAGTGTRFTVEFVSVRAPAEVLGFYRDLLPLEGWELSERAGGLRASAPAGTITLTVQASSPTRVTLALEWNGAR